MPSRSQWAEPFRRPIFRFAGLFSPSSVSGCHWLASASPPHADSCSSAALLRLLSPSGQALFPMAAIIIEAGLAELALKALRYRPSWTSFLSAGVAALLWDFAHPFITQTLQAGVDLPLAYFRIVRKGASMLGIEHASVAIVVGALVALRIVAGVLCGTAAFVLARGLHRRLGLHASPQSG